MITGIVIALPQELAALTKQKLVKGCVSQLTECILVIWSGVGPENASAAAELLVKAGASRLLSWGCAAALDAGLQPGDLVLAEGLIDAEQTELNHIDGAWLNQVHAACAGHLPVRKGKMAESKSMVARSDEKAQLANATGAIAVDMESIATAKVAQKYGLPFLAIRAIADPCAMNLPKAVGVALDDQGEVILGKLLRYLFLHPTELSGLVKLGMHFNAAQKTLKLVAKQMNNLIIYPQVI